LDAGITLSSGIKKYKFSNFEVYVLEDNYSFFHIQISDKKEFMKNFAQYLLNYTNLLRYAKNSSNIDFKPTKENYVQLYRRLNLFVDDENIIEYTSDEEVKSILKHEGELIREEKEEIEIRLSKIGRMGEYIFHLILSDFFKFDCIIPKISLTTDKNQSVFGIDELFLCEDKKMILFGESKVTKNLSSGISLLKKSLEKYETEIRDEYLLVLLEENLKMKDFCTVFDNAHKVCITFDEFIKKAEIKSIGIPLFIAHGQEVDSEKILSSLKKRIERKTFFDIETKYYAISLPIIDKNKFVKYLTDEINKKLIEIRGESNIN